MIEREDTERSHSGQSRVARYQQSTTHAEQSGCTEGGSPAARGGRRATGWAASKLQERRAGHKQAACGLQGRRAGRKWAARGLQGRRAGCKWAACGVQGQRASCKRASCELQGQQATDTPGQPAPQTSQHGSVGNPTSAASDGVIRNDDHNTTHPEETNAAKSQPRVTISVLAGESPLPSPVPLKPQRPPCFDPSQRGGPTVQAWLFTLNVFFDANYVSEDTAKIRYAVSLLRGPAMDWWRVIVTKPVDYATLPTREGQTVSHVGHVVRRSARSN
ncbi:unnamed protein product [Closterium sp. NIES-54]